MKINFWKLGITILVSIYFFRYALHPGAGYFIDNANLLIHEAGHFVFGGMGRTMMFLGGGLLQVLVPIIFVGYFLYSEQYFSGALALFWVGENIINVSVYIGDAQARVLPLLTGDFNSHDWYNLLGGFNLLPQAGIISQIVYFIGVAVLLLAAVLAIRFSFKRKQPLIID
jgi:multisubunit Na+/H+ antiporter MnhC subunit